MNRAYISLFSIAALLTMCSLLSSCFSTPRTKVHEKFNSSTEIPFVRNGITTRKEIIFRLGEPVSEYESGRISVYWLKRLPGDHLRETPRIPLNFGGGGIETGEGVYNLVLVFQEDDILVNHSIVFIR